MNLHSVILKVVGDVYLRNLPCHTYYFLWFYLSYFVLYRNIEDVTQQVNQLHQEVEDLELENEEMRERLGIGSRDELDVEGIKKKRLVKEEQAQALNRVLQKEVGCI